MVNGVRAVTAWADGRGEAPNHGHATNMLLVECHDGIKVKVICSITFSLSHQGESHSLCHILSHIKMKVILSITSR